MQDEVVRELSIHYNPLLQREVRGNRCSNKNKRTEWEKK